MRKTYEKYIYKNILIRRIDLYGRKYVCEIENNNIIKSYLSYTLSGIKKLIKENI